MSTRATYQFNIVDEMLGNPTVCFYIHHDGYPKGAAGYLLPALLNTQGIGVAESFFAARASQAQFIAGHNNYSNTEFAYTITIEENKDPIISYAGRNNEEWVGIAENIPLHEFIADELGIQLFKTSNALGFNNWYSEESARTELMDEAKKILAGLQEWDALDKNSLNHALIGYRWTNELLKLEQRAEKLSGIVNNENLHLTIRKMVVEIYLDYQPELETDTVEPTQKTLCKSLNQLALDTAKADIFLSARIEGMERPLDVEDKSLSMAASELEP